MGDEMGANRTLRTDPDPGTPSDYPVVEIPG